MQYNTRLIGNVNYMITEYKLYKLEKYESRENSVTRMRSLYLGVRLRFHLRLHIRLQCIRRHSLIGMIGLARPREIFCPLHMHAKSGIKKLDHIQWWSITKYYFFRVSTHAGFTYSHT